MANVACSVPLRNFLGTTNGYKIAVSCASMKIAYTWGVCLTLFVGLFVLHFYTKYQQENFENDLTIKYQTVIAPIWLAFIPLVYAVYTQLYAIPNARKYWESEELHFSTSDMPKKDYLVYRIADDRLQTTSAVSLLGTSFIGSTALFGPYLRADSGR